MPFLSSRRAMVLSAILVVQALIYYFLPKVEYVPTARPLTELPKQIGTWQATSESKPEQEIQDLLRADDALTRIYTGGSKGEAVSMFVAFFRTQRAGVQPHSPKVCLPGSGWTPEQDGFLDISIPGRAEPITVNRYVVAHGESRSVVLYWYQTPHRVVASEFAAKFHLVADSLRYQRSDTALVRIIAAADNDGLDNAEQRAVEFVKAAFEPVRNHLPL